MSQDYEDDDTLGDQPEDRLPVEGPTATAAANRTNAPGIFLIICGVLNLLGLGVWVLGGVLMAGMTADKLDVQIEENKKVGSPFGAMIEAQVDQIVRQKTGKDPKDLPPADLQRERRAALEEVVQQNKQQSLWQLPMCGAMNLAAVILPILAGARMRALRSYGLCVAGAVVAAVPCVSPASCPCLLGMIFGVWALIVLLNPDVKNAFS